MATNYLYNLPNNTTSLDQIIIQTATEVPALVPMFLFFIFFVVTLGGIGLEKARRGTADYPMWCVIGSISMLMITLILSLAIGFISLDWLVIVVVITILSGVWLFLSRRLGEV